jgi:hypothetical protein
MPTVQHDSVPWIIQSVHLFVPHVPCCPFLFSHGHFGLRIGCLVPVFTYNNILFRVSHRIKSRANQIPLPRKICLTTPCAWLSLANPNPCRRSPLKVHLRPSILPRTCLLPGHLMVVLCRRSTSLSHKNQNRTTRRMGVTSRDGSVLGDIGSSQLHPLPRSPTPTQANIMNKVPLRPSSPKLNNPMHANVGTCCSTSLLAPRRVETTGRIGVVHRIVGWTI